MLWPLDLMTIIFARERMYSFLINFGFITNIFAKSFGFSFGFDFGFTYTHKFFELCPPLIKISDSCCNQIQLNCFTVIGLVTIFKSKINPTRNPNDIHPYLI